MSILSVLIKQLIANHCTLVKLKITIEHAMDDEERRRDAEHDKYYDV